MGSHAGGGQSHSGSSFLTDGNMSLCSDNTPGCAGGAGSAYDDTSPQNKKQPNPAKAPVSSSALFHMSVINKIQALGTPGAASIPSSGPDPAQKSSVTRTTSALSLMSTGGHKPNVRFQEAPPPTAQRLAAMHSIAANNVREAHSFRETSGQTHLNELIERSMRRSSSPGSHSSEGEEDPPTAGAGAGAGAGVGHRGKVYQYINKKESNIKSYGESICDLHTEFESVNARITKKYVSDPKSLKGVRGTDGAGGRAMAIAGDTTQSILKMASKLNALTEEDSLVQQVWGYGYGCVYGYGCMCMSMCMGVWIWAFVYVLTYIMRIYICVWF